MLNLIQYMHDKYYYEEAEMALIDTDVRRTDVYKRQTMTFIAVPSAKLIFFLIMANACKKVKPSAT